MHFTKSHIALIGLGAATVLFAACPAAASDLMEQRKTLSAALNNFLNAMPRMARESQAKAHNVSGEMMLKLAELDHLRDLDDLLAVTHEPAVQNLLTERLSRRRSGIDMGCRTLAINWPIFVKFSQDPVLIREITATQKVVEGFCASVRNR